MAAPLLLSVENVQRRRSRGASFVSLLTASFLQAFAGALIIVVPLLGTQALPKPHRIPPTFVLSVTPPPPRGTLESRPVERKAVRPTSPRVSLSHHLLVPPDIPDGILDEMGGELTGAGGVEGGVPGHLWTESAGGLRPLREEPAAPVRPGGDIKPPKRIQYVVPDYPELAKKARVEGIVILEAVIDPNGRVGNLRVLRSVPLLDDAAVSAVQQWRYEPTLLNGVPVPIIMTITVRFILEDP